MSDAIVEARDLEVGWSADDVLLERLSFDVIRGEVFAILGKSGCGKSTLLRYLAGLDPPLGGTISIDGEAPELEGKFPRFGVMLQGGALVGSMSVLDNVALPLSTWIDLPAPMIARMAHAKLALVGLDAAADKRPGELSGGMLKRAAIARALALETPLLFLDEPTAGLDPVTSAGIDELVTTLNRAMRVTVVLVTHELGSISAVADRCSLLDRDARGALAEGPPEELAKSDDPRVHAFFHRTTKGTT